MNFRSLADSVASSLIARSLFANRAGKTFAGERDLYLALGYSRVLSANDFRDRYRRNAVAARIVDAQPQDTWRGGFDLLEDEENLDKETEFEQAWAALDNKFKITPLFLRADKLAGLGHYAIIVIGAPGQLDTPLTTCSMDDIAYFQPYAQEDATIAEFDTDEKSPRFGRPAFYNLKRSSTKYSASTNQAIVGKRVHYTRVWHIADGLLDDPVYGTPRLERVWNLLDDLEKVTGGGAEAFWNRANQGMQVDIDPTLDLDEAARQEMREQVENYRHKLERVLRTRGTKINMLGSDVADIKGPAEAIILQISAGSGIPQRVLMGSEQGKLASEQDSVKYYREVEARRRNYAETQILRPFIDRLIELGALPKPKKYEVSWSQIRTMDDDEKATLALKFAQVNATNGEEVISTNEIREKALGLDARDDATPRREIRPEPELERAARRKGEPSWKSIHRVADRFPQSNKARRQARLRRGEAGTQS